ncbi:hypothetical protein K2X85_09615 [bacterium]|nr:hypothetical protein [bacterium]
MDLSRRSLLFLWVGLVLLILIPRCWVALRAVSPNKDAIRYWSAADQWLTLPASQALTAIETLPVYPALLAGIKWFGGATTPEAWWRSSQALGILAYLLFLLAAFGVGIRLFGPIRAWWGCALVSLLPRQIRYSVDILADNVSAALLWSALAVLLFAMTKPRSYVSLGLVSLLLGFAALTRPDALVWGLVLGGMALVLVWKKELRLAQLMLLVMPSVILLSAHAYLRGEISPSNTARAFVGNATAGEPGASDSKTPLDRIMPAANENQVIGFVVASGIAVWELSQETRVLLLIFFAIGLWNGGLGQRRGVILLGCLLVATFLMLVWCRWKAGFLTGRYFMPILPILGFGAAAGIESTALYLWRLRWFANVPESLAIRVAYAGSLLVAGVLAWPTVTQRLHADRWAHRQAADWLAHQTEPSQSVFDPSWVSAFFSGRPMAIPTSLSSPAWAVLDCSMESSPPRGLEEAFELSAAGQVLVEFPRRPGSSEVAIRVTRLTPKTNHAEKDQTDPLPIRR